MEKIFLVVFVILICGLSFAQDDPLFEVKDGEVTIFSVTPSGITINGMKFKTVAEDNKLELYDADGKKLFYASPENARFIFHPPADPADVDRGGFAISTIASDDPTDEDGINYFDITPENTFIGHEAGIANTTAWNNIIIGNQAGVSNQTATNQFFIGNQAGNALTAGYGNTFVGHSTGEASTDCENNTFVGYFSGNDNLIGDNNVYLGYAAGSKGLGEKNILIGSYVSYDKTSGDENVMIGYGSGYNNVSGTGNVFIGTKAGYSEDGSNKLYIENTNSSSPLIYGEFDNDILAFNANVGIGTSSPDELLHISGGKLKIGDEETFEDGGSNTIAVNSHIRTTRNGIYDLGTSLYRWRTVYATNGVSTTSDRRDKENILPVQSGLEKILQLNPVTFNWKGKSSEDKKFGLIAQELMKVVPEVVKTHDKKIVNEETGETENVELDRYGVYYSDLIPLLIKGMQEQQKLIEELNGISQDQQKTIDNLNYKIGKLEKTINN